MSVLKVDGGSGTLFEVTDNLSGSLFNVNDITGLITISITRPVSTTTRLRAVLIF